MEKKQFGFKVNPDTMTEFHLALDDFHRVTGVKPVRQDSLETAIKDYTQKLKN